MSKTPDYIIAFAEAVYPECPELGLSMARSEEVILRDATKVILKLQSQLAASQKRVEVLENLMSYTKAFAFNVNPYRIEPKDTMEDECEELRIGIGRLCKVERILREGLKKYADSENWMYDEAYGPYENAWRECCDGYLIACEALKAAEEVK
jgi:hypothetical protein